MANKWMPPERFGLKELGLEVRHEAPAGSTTAQVTIGPEIHYHEFDRCPICLQPDPRSREHVPPEGVGGKCLTLTCLDCNNRLGSRVEDELIAWYHGAIGRARLSSSGSSISGFRKIPRILYRTTNSGEFVLIQLGKITPDHRRMLDHGEFELEFTTPEPHRYRIAALKQAYLAICLYLGYIPTSSAADAVRGDLIAARDAADNRSVRPSPIADRLQLGRLYGRGSAPSVAICSVEAEPEQAWFGVLLANSFVVSWPDGLCC